MGSSMRVELMTIFAVSGSTVLLVHQVHKHLFNNLIKKFEFEIRGSMKHKAKKKVRFAKDVMELPMENKSDCTNVTKAQQVEDEKGVVMHDKNWKTEQNLKDVMPPNRVVLYREIMKYRNLKGMLNC
ncbi:uncharacterized protein LOC113871388 [Abrus precatorius]|uniref:Uncharacterized protein LOC113871388 n=1 Tax=Abrus precatorius TaxID=3816 RepID=A0A8B8M920_ABRPR|nr:uncharacterized protein LOC113871388 [Abrus precatorius]